MSRYTMAVATLILRSVILIMLAAGISSSNNSPPPQCNALTGICR